MADSRPNIILIITDQQRFDTIAALGFDYMETPNLDRLVHEGVSFTNCHITAPFLRARPRQSLHRLLSSHHRHPEERRPLDQILGGRPQRQRLPLRQRRQDAHLTLRDAPRLSRALRGRKQGSLPRRPLLL